MKIDWRNGLKVVDCLFPILLIVGILIARTCSGEELSGTRPEGVPDPNGWPIPPVEESITSGTYRLANTTLTVRLSVEPGFPGIFRITVYRTCDHAAEACDPETLLWLKPTAPNGQRPRSILYYRLQRRTWKKLWLGHERYWHRLPQDSPEYRMELKRAGALFFLLDAIRYGADPAMLEF